MTKYDISMCLRDKNKARARMPNELGNSLGKHANRSIPPHPPPSSVLARRVPCVVIQRRRNVSLREKLMGSESCCRRVNTIFQSPRKQSREERKYLRQEKPTTPSQRPSMSTNKQGEKEFRVNSLTHISRGRSPHYQNGEGKHRCGDDYAHCHNGRSSYPTSPCTTCPTRPHT